MIRELLLAGFITAVGLSVAGAGTYFYQWLVREQATLRYDGRTVLHSLGHLLMSFLCGPYIMLQLGWGQERGGTLSATWALASAVLAFGWAFITGLFTVGLYVAFTG
jgi:hypothetical protein